jgi:hypothetical protein
MMTKMNPSTHIFFELLNLPCRGVNFLACMKLVDKKRF